MAYCVQQCVFIVEGYFKSSSFKDCTRALEADFPRLTAPTNPAVLRTVQRFRRTSSSPVLFRSFCINREFGESCCLQDQGLSIVPWPIPVAPEYFICSCVFFMFIKKLFFVKCWKTGFLHNGISATPLGLISLPRSVRAS